MKLFHLSDLHLGKRINDFPMLEDQTYILHQITALAAEHAPDAILMAGDIYDKSTPPIEAVQLLDSFLVNLHTQGIAVFIISGNHDSAERMAFGAELMTASNIHIVQSYNGKMQPITIADEHGDLHIWMLPYLRPSAVRRYFEDTKIVTYSEALTAAISVAEIDTSARNILIAHQFITGAVSSDSEEIFVGGSENVDGTIFDNFDYVALGHLHRPQQVIRNTMRYSGAPLKYSFSETSKTVTVVDMGGKGVVEITELPLTPLRDMREIRGEYASIMNNCNTDDYIRIILTDEHEEPDALAKLRNIYPNIMRLEYDNKRTQAAASFETAATLEKKSPPQLFAELYERQNGQPMSQQQAEYVQNLFKTLWQEGEYA